MKNNYLSGFFGIVLVVFCAPQLHAQLVNCNVFLQGDYLEVGLAPNGAFGTSEPAPAGYHPNVSDSMYNSCTFALTVLPEMGFVADPNKDGWAVGIPNYYGDYILPGSMAREGFAMSDSTGSASAYSSYYHSGFSGFTGALSGSNTAYFISGTTKRGVWSGTFGGDSITVSQTTIVDTTNLYLDMHISFANLHDTATDTFYYLRTVNPHNEATLTSSLATKLKVEYQLPNAYNMTVVSATGTTYPDAYMEMGTVDTRARGFLIKDSTLPVSGDLASIWAGDTVNYQYSDSITGNLAMGLVFRFILGAGDSTTIDFGYSFKSGIIDSVFGDTTGTGGTTTLKTKNMLASGNISVYPNPTGNTVNVTGLKPGESISVYDMIGRKVVQNMDYNGQQTYSFSLDNLPSGMYLVTVNDFAGNLVSVTRVAKN